MTRTPTRVGAAIITCSTLALRAGADVNTLVEWQVSPDNINWSASLSTQFGREIWVRALVTYTGTQQPLGLASMVFQPTVSTWNAAGASIDQDTVCSGSIFLPPNYCAVFDPDDPTQFGRVSPFNRTRLTETTQLTGHVHTNGSGGAPAGTWLRIAQRQVTSWIGGTGNTSGGSGLSIAQLGNVGRTTSDPAFNSQLYQVLVYKFGITTLSNDAAHRTLTIDSPPTGFGNFNSNIGERQVYWWGAINESSGSIRGAAIVLPATINVQPCGSSDFNHDGDAGTDADIETFFACLAGTCCQTCGTADFNGDGDIGTDADIEAFFRVLSGGSC